MTLLDQLQQVYEQCRVPGWDGYGAEPVSEATYQRARDIMSRWPADIMPPTFGAEPDGSLTIEWSDDHDTTGILSVSISETEIVGAYSGTFRIPANDAPERVLTGMVHGLFGSAN